MELTKAVIIFAGFLLVVCHGLPASKKDEVEYVPAYGDQPIVDTGVFSTWNNPFGGFFDDFEGLMQRMRQKIASLLKTFPSSNSTEDISPFAGLDFPNFGGLDLSKGNTSSITKEINGHKVIINETEYKKEDDFGGAYFKVRIIDVKPDEVTTESEAEALTTKDREEVNNSLENEISKSKEAFGEAASRFENFNSEWSRIDPVQTIDSNELQTKENVREIPIDLSRDTYVNEIAAQNGFPINPDAEIFDVASIR